MQMCVRCKKRIAVVFLTRMDPSTNEAQNIGLCIHCAKELGVKPVNDILDKMGISEEEFENMTGELMSALGTVQGVDTDSDSPDDGEDAGAPPIDLPKLFEQMGGAMMMQRDIPTADGMEDHPADQGDAKKDKKSKKKKMLDSFCTNLTQCATEGKVDRIIGRENELARVIQILCRRQKNNPCLIGEPGVGKTAIAEALAQRIVDGNVPERLRGCEVYLVDLTALVAGTQFRGQFESRVLGLIKEVKEQGNIILVIDEVHNIVGAGDAEGSMNAANMLKPALSRGEIQVIGATTLKEYRKYIEKDTALERRFQPIIVNEPSESDTVEMLRGIKVYYEAYHRILIPDHVLEAAVRLSERYITDRFLPDKAIDLIDETASHVALTSTDLNELKKIHKELPVILRQIEELESKVEKIDESESAGCYAEIASCKVELSRLEARKNALEKACEGLAISISDLANVIEIWTGIPASDINQQEFEQLDHLEERILRRIVGQNEAVKAVVRAIKRKRAGVSPKKAPVSFIFAGPTGVGKTELVKVLAEDLFHQPDMLIRLDMSEFMEKHSVSRIIGSPPGYVGYDEAGQLTERIRRHPYSVVLFDEIEKAHPDVLNILLQVLDDGRITDATGRTVSFENTLIVMTTNAGSDTSGSISGFSTDTRTLDANRTEKALLSFLRPEFLNRVSEVITFRHLSIEDFVSISKIMLNDIVKTVALKGVELTYSEDVARFVAQESFSEKFGARNMRRYLETHVEDALAEQLIAGYKSGISKATIIMHDGALEVYCL